MSKRGTKTFTKLTLRMLDGKPALEATTFEATVYPSMNGKSEEYWSEHFAGIETVGAHYIKRNLLGYLSTVWTYPAAEEPAAYMLIEGDQYFDQHERRLQRMRDRLVCALDWHVNQVDAKIREMEQERDQYNHLVNSFEAVQDDNILFVLETL